MDLAVGNILTGKVTGITKFGAFVSVAPGKSGLVHISEIANTYVNDIHDHLTEGQEVTVKVIGIDQSGRINLSIKAALPTARPPRQDRSPQMRRPQYQAQAPAEEALRQPAAAEPSFEDKLKRFMQDSDSKMAGVRQYAERKNSRRRGGGR